MRRTRHRDPTGEPTDPTSGSPDHLSQINTVWTMVAQAHANEAADGPTRAARAWLWNQYERAIRQYVEHSIHDKHRAEEVFHDFGVRILEGDLRGASQERGKFRFYLKQALRRHVLNYYRAAKLDAARLRKIPRPTSNESVQVSVADQQFLENWRADLLQGTWQRLHDHELSTGRALFTVLEIRASHAGESSERLAQIASERLGRGVDARWFNRQVFDARKLIAAFLLEEVGRTLSRPTHDAIEEELIALGLLDFPSVKEALRELRKKSESSPQAGAESPGEDADDPHRQQPDAKSE